MITHEIFISNVPRLTALNHEAWPLTEAQQHHYGNQKV